MHNSGRNNNLNKVINIKYILFVICVTFLSYQTIDLFNVFMSGKTVTSISVGTIRNTTLPAISICLDALDFQKLSRLNYNASKLYEQYLRLIDNINRNNINLVNDVGLNMSVLYRRAWKIYFNSKININIKNDLLENLIPFINEKLERIFLGYFFLSSVYGGTDEDLVRSDNGRYIIVSPLPMESLNIFISNNIPFVQKCYTMFSHSELSWKNIKAVFSSFHINLNFPLKSYPFVQPMQFYLTMHSPYDLDFENWNFLNPGFSYLIRFLNGVLKDLEKDMTPIVENMTQKYTQEMIVFSIVIKIRLNTIVKHKILSVLIC